MSNTNDYLQKQSATHVLSDSRVKDADAEPVTLANPGNLSMLGADDIQPTLVTTGGGGGKFNEYYVVAVFADGSTTGAGNLYAEESDGPETLDETHYSDISWAAVPRAVGYRVYTDYRESEPAVDAITLLATTTETTFRDDGVAGEAAEGGESNTTGTASLRQILAAADLIIRCLGRVRIGAPEAGANNTHIRVDDSSKQIVINTTNGVINIDPTGGVGNVGTLNAGAGNGSTVLGDWGSDGNATVVAIADDLRRIDSLAWNFAHDAQTIQRLDGDTQTIAHTAANGVRQSAPASAPSGLANGQISFYLDEVAHKLMVAVKYSDGTTKTGEWPLT